MQSELFEHAIGEVIDEIRPKPSDPNLRQVRVDGRTVATLRATDIEAIGLRVGQRWSKSLAKRVGEAMAANKARRDAMRLLSGRAFSEEELTQRLLKRGHEVAIAQRVVNDARRDGWLDDRRLADDIVRTTTRKRPAGRRLLEVKLQNRGVKAPVIASLSSSNERNAAINLAKDQMARMDRVAAPVAARRIAGLLARRGFDDSDIAAAMESIGYIDPHQELNDGFQE